MALLDSTARAETHRDLMREQLGDVAITKIQLRNAVDAVDAWLDANAAALNSALPTAARTGLTTAQKALLLTYVVKKRYLTGV